MTTGDVNQDGMINVSDIVAIVSFILGVIDIDQYVYDEGIVDINSDEIINVIDIVAIVTHILET